MNPDELSCMVSETLDEFAILCQLHSANNFLSNMEQKHCEPHCKSFPHQVVVMRLSIAPGGLCIVSLTRLKLVYFEVLPL